VITFIIVVRIVIGAMGLLLSLALLPLPTLLSNLLNALLRVMGSPITGSPVVVDPQTLEMIPAGLRKVSFLISAADNAFVSIKAYSEFRVVQALLNCDGLVEMLPHWSLKESLLSVHMMRYRHA
jgi:hypothetical protein